MRRSLVGLGAIAMLTAGCPSLPLMQSAETLPEGESQHAIGIEWFRATHDDASDERRLAYSQPIAIPSYVLRHGVADGIDFGIRTATFLALAVDLKVQLLDTSALDLSVDPGVQFAYTWGWVQLPLLVGVRFGDTVELVANGRVAYQVTLDESTGDLTPVLEDAGLFLGAGGSLYVRLGDVAIVPEVNVVRGYGGADPVIVSLSLGIVLGGHPGRRQVGRAREEPLPPPDWTRPDAPPPDTPPPQPTPATPPGQLQVPDGYNQPPPQEPHPAPSSGYDSPSP